MLLSVGGGEGAAEMNHVCPGVDCASFSVGAAAAAAAAVAVYEPSWTELIGHMLPWHSVCVALERAKPASE